MTMDCFEVRSHLHAYIDGELERASVMELDQHLGSCDACRTQVARHSALRGAIARHASYHRAPAGLARRIRARLAEGAPASPARPRRQWFPVGALVAARPQWLRLGAAIAATALVTWTATLHFAAPAEDDSIAERVIAGHARSVITGRVADVASSDQHAVKPWLSSRLDFSLPVVDLTGVGFPLIGGRLDYLDERPIAALVYKHREHIINLFVWPSREATAAAPVRAVARRGYNVLHWTEGGMTYWAVSDLNATEMRSFVSAYASAK
jgi:mycothiol system anti-sigma-R factor